MIEEEKKSDAKKMLWPTLAMMAFSTVWGFGNVVNGYVYFDGTKVVFSWVLMFLLYFVPYALMVGELGATFKNANGGVSSWVNATMGAKWAYYAGWTYWACHVVYISSKGTGGLRAMAWGIFGNTKWYDGLPTAWRSIVQENGVRRAHEVPTRQGARPGGRALPPPSWTPCVFLGLLLIFLFS